MKTPRTHPHPGLLPFLAALLLPFGAAAGAEVTIEREIQPPHTGYIDFDPDRRTYETGERIDVTATPRGRFSFKEWGGALHSDAPNPYEGFEVREDATLVARFEAGYLAERALLSPRRNTFYLEHPRDLWFSVHRNRNRLVAVERDGQPVRVRRQPVRNLADSEPLPDSLRVRIPADRIEQWGSGRHRIDFRFADGLVLEAYVEVLSTEDTEASDMNIIGFFVGHGDCVLIELPNGETLMLDTGTRDAAEAYVIPFLKRHLPKDENGRQRIDHVFVTHWHYDHFQGVGALLEVFDIGNVRYNLAYPPNAYGDYDDRENPNDPYGYGEYGFEPRHWEGFRVGNRIKNIGGVEILILNAGAFDEDDDRYRHYRPEHYDGYYGRNNRSLSFKLTYGDFVYGHGGDIYQHAQRAILSTFPDDVRAHIYHANHHFHGGVEAEYLIETEPYLFLTSANSAVYDRDAFACVLLDEVIPELERTSSRFIENLLSFEVGHTVIRIDGDRDWNHDSLELWHETYFLNNHHHEDYSVPYLFGDGRNQ